MSTNTELQTTNQKKGFSQLLESPAIKQRIEEVLGERKSQFITSALSLYNTNKSLQDCEPASLFNACLTATSLNLPINNNLGLAYIIPYNEKQPDNSFLKVAQFQIGYKGFKQLALRTSQFKYINSIDVRKGELINYDYLTGGIAFDWEQDYDKRQEMEIIGYVSYFELLNGYSNTLFMDIKKLRAHAKKYSKNFAKFGTGLWKDDENGMCLKTVTKLNLSKNAPLTIEMQTAILSDQAVIKDKEQYTYIDNELEIETLEENNQEEENNRTLAFLETIETLEEFKKFRDDVPADVLDRLSGHFDDKENVLTLLAQTQKEEKPKK